MDHALGYHPIFQLVRCCFRLADRPFVVGGLCRLIGYLGAACRRERVALPPDAVAFLRAEQMGKLRALVGARGR
jgi:hypothetical protein